MRKALMLIAAVVLVVGVGVLQPAWAQVSGRAADFGKQWVRSHPYTLMGLTQFDNFQPEMYGRLGLGPVQIWKPDEELLRVVAESKMPWHGHITARQGVNKAIEQRVSAIIAQYPGDIAWIFNDEPNLQQMPLTRDVLAWFRKKYPDRLVYSNALPMGDRPWKYAGGEAPANYSYEQYIEDFIEIIQPDVMMFDIYPFQDTAGVANCYLRNMQIVREASLKGGIPYWVFVQSYIDKNRRMPSDSDNRLQLFVPLAMGYTGMSYFTYDGSFTPGFLTQGRSPSQAFDYAAQANREVMNIAGPIRFLTSTHVRFVKGTHETPVPQGLLASDKYLLVDPIIKDITVNVPEQIPDLNEDSATYLADRPYLGGLIGYFRDDAGQKYFMLTNMWHSMTATGQQRALTFHVMFDPAVNKVLRLSRSTGKVDTLAVDPKKGLAVTLPGGTGDLFKFDTGPFVGLE